LCGSGQLSLKLGKYGAFIGCANYPDCSYTRQLGDDPAAAEARAADEPQVLGIDPETGEEVSLRSGRFGPYVQLGAGDKPKRASLPKGWQVEDMTFDKALQLLRLPRRVGEHPETRTPIEAGIGRYGPFLLHDGKYANLESVEDVFTIGLNRAVTLIAERKERGGRGRSAPAALATLGEHPEAGGPVTVRDGRYGPYVNLGKINATLPKGKDPATVTLDEAVAMIDAKAASGGTGAKSGTKAPAKSARGKAAGAKTGSARKATGTAGGAAKSKAAATTKAKGKAARATSGSGAAVRSGSGATAKSRGGKSRVDTGGTGGTGGAVGGNGAGKSTPGSD
jgi:DNA topoisomerase-1